MILTPPVSSYFQLFKINIHYYSLCILLGLVVSLFVLFNLAKNNSNVSKEVIFDFAPLLILFSIIGARLYYVLLAFNYYSKNLIEIFMVWQGGIAIHGAFLGGLIFGIFYFKKKKLPFFKYADIFCAVLPLGQAIGRWGNFFNSEAFGLPINPGAPFMLYVKAGYRPEKYFDFEYFHPVFLYESILNFIIFLLLCFVYKKTAKQVDGLVFFLYILLYSAVRLPLEFLRLDTVFYLFKIPFPVIVSCLGIATGVLGTIFTCLKKPVSQ